MSKTKSHFHASAVASGVPFDKDNEPDCEFESEDVQAVIEELCRRTARASSPGYQWGRAGNQTANIWLKNNEVSSQKVGLPIDLENAVLSKLFVGNEDVNTFDITLYHHDGNSINLTSFITVTVTAARSGWFDINDFGDISIPQDKQLAARLTNGSAKNPQVVAIVKGEAPA